MNSPHRSNKKKAVSTLPGVNPAKFSEEDSLLFFYFSLEIILPENEVLFQSFYASLMPLRCYYSFPMQDPNIVRAIHHTQCITVLILILWYFFILQFSILSISFREREPIEPIHICRL